MADEPLEIELRLRVSPADLPRLARPRLWKRWTDGVPETRHLVSNYFDTPDLRLHRLGIVLRVRQDGDRRIQCVKRASDGGAALNGRAEWEHELLDDRPDPELVDDRELRDILGERRIRDRLEATYSTDIERTIIPLRFEGSTLELALDRGAIIAGDRRESVCEAEIELKSGSPGAIHAFAREMHRHVAFTIETRAKSERGHALMTDTPPGPVRARRLRLSAKATTGEAFARIGREALSHLLANEASVRLARDAEGVHQMRVAVRRLRSALAAFRALLPADERRGLSASVKWIAAQCGRAREWDVFKTALLEPLHERLPDEAALARFDAALERARRAAYRTVARMLASERYTDTILRLAGYFDGGEWRGLEGFDQPAASFARGALKRLHRRVHRLGDRLAALSTEELHGLRIEAKKLRYVGEFLSGPFDRRAAKAYLGALSEVQECLGSLNDAVMTRALMHVLERRARGHDKLVLARASGLVIGFGEARIEADLKRLPDAWARFAAIKPFWK